MKKRKRRLKSKFAFFLSSRSFQLAHFVKCKRQLKQSLLELIPSEPNPSSEWEKKNRNRFFKSSIKRKTRHSQVAVGALWRQNWTKKVLNNKCRVVVQPIQPFAFTTFSLPLQHHRAFLHGRGGGEGRNPPDNIMSHFSLITFTW